MRTIFGRAPRMLFGSAQAPMMTIGASTSGARDVAASHPFNCCCVQQKTVQHSDGRVGGASTSRVLLTSYQLPQCLTLLLRTWMSTLRLQRPALLLRQSWRMSHQLGPTQVLHLSLSTSRPPVEYAAPAPVVNISRLRQLARLSMNTMRLRLQRTQCTPLWHRSSRTALHLSWCPTPHLHLSLSTWRLRWRGQSWAQHQYPSLVTSHSSKCHSVKGCGGLSGNDPRDTSRAYETSHILR